MVDTARRGLANKGKPVVGEKVRITTVSWTRTDFKSMESAARDAHGRKDESREAYGWHNGTYNWREHDGQGGAKKRLPAAAT